MNRRRGGFTLLEVILTMLIAGLLIAAVAAALRIHLRLVDSGRAEVEQAQLARALLRRIADDLRSAVPVVVETTGASAGASIDDIAAASGLSGSGGSSGGSSSGTSGGSSSSARVQNITGSTGVTDIGGSTSGSSSGGTSSGSSGRSGSASATGGGTGGGTSSGAGMQSGSSGGSSSSNDASQSATGDETATQPPGVYGTQYDLQVDVTRLPRGGGAAAPASMTFDPTTGAALATGVEPPSDVKTVGYYVSSAAAAPAQATTVGTATPIGSAGGLVRRQVPREAALYSAATGGLDAAQYEQLLAAEVTALEFRYYDGTEWLTEWDSSTRQALPVCVEIALTMRSPDGDAPIDPLTVFSTELPSVDKTYRLLVHLPGGEPSTAEATSTTTESTSSSTETTP